MRYTLVIKDEGFREEVYDSLDEISQGIEGIDWITGNYSVFDDSEFEYEAEWTRRPSEKRFLLFFTSIDIGEYRLVRTRRSI